MLPQTNNFLSEHTFSISSEEELINSFRPHDQKKLILPEKMIYPLNIRSYLTWKESSGVYTYLVFKIPNWDQPRGCCFQNALLPALNPRETLQLVSLDGFSEMRLGFLSEAQNRSSQAE